MQSRNGHKGVLKHLWIAAALTFWFAASAQARVDLDKYVVDDGVKDIKISPTGDYFAMTVPREGQTGLMIMRRSDRAITASFHFRSGTHVHDFWWVNPERVLMSISETMGTRDDPLPTGELYGMNVDGGRRGLLVGWRVQGAAVGTRISAGQAEEVAAFLIDPLPADDQHVLVSVWPFSKDPFARAERMDVYTGRRSRVATIPVQRGSFTSDNAGVVRFGAGAGADNFGRLYYRDGASAEWRLLNDERESGRVETALGFSADDATAYLRVSQPEGPDAVVALDVATGERTEALRHDTVDPRVILQDGWGAPLGVEYLGGLPSMAFLDESSEGARLYRSLAKAFPDTRISIPSSTRDGRYKVVLVESDVDPGSFYLFDTAGKQMHFILARKEKIDPEQAAPMRPVSLKSRDGLDLHGFVTVPRASSGQALPMVVLPHGGPFGPFDAWRFDDDTQLLAEAGYAVLRVNFRGSGNYGRAFREAGARQWGGTMQDDLTDATRWAIAEGIADPARICIYGASYGAYAALMGAAKEPDLYRCAIGYVGVYDLPMMRRADSRSSLWMRTWTGDWVGDDPTALAAVSPNRLADRIQAAVFLAAGGEDQVAPIEHSRSMERALRRAGKPVQTLYYPKEGHGFHQPAHRRAFYQQLIEFLDAHIGAAPGAGG